MIDQNTLKSIEDLHRLKNDGIITEEEFERSKQELLFGGRPATSTSQAEPGTKTPLTAIFGPAPTSLPAKDDHVGWITLPIRRYADFKGRSTRKEFWMFQLIYVALVVVGFVAILDGGEASASGLALALGRLVFGLACLGTLGLIVPLLALEARRFHDLDKSPWFVLLNFIPYFGVFIVLFAMLLPGTEGDNQYGPDPLAG